MFTMVPGDEFLAEIAGKLCKERMEAKQKREQAGLDKIWAKARMQFQGIDEKNQGVEGMTTMDSSVRLTGYSASSTEKRSTVFDNITRAYTETGTSKVSDILLSTGKMPWDLKPSPVSDAETVAGIIAKYPEVTALLKGLPELQDKMLRSEEQNVAGIGEAKKYIKDYLAECHWLGEIREQILEAGKVGAGVLKGPIPRYVPPSPTLRVFVELLPKEIQAELIPQLYYRPYSETIKVENLFPDHSCGHDIHNGSYVWERIPDFSKRQLYELKDDPSYFEEQIEKCCKEEPQNVEGKDKGKGSSYELWIRTGEIDLTCLLKFLDLEREEDDDDPIKIFGVVVLCNSRVIKIANYWLETPSFPYDVLPWEGRDGSWDGIGIPERIETPQRGLNASLRALQDNLAWSVGPGVLEWDGVIEPADGADGTEHYPYRRYKVKKDLFNQDMDPTKALSFLEFPNYSAAILPIVNYWLGRAEQIAGLPLILQGQAPSDTVGVTQALQNNATTNLRQIIKACDDRVFVPHIQRYYDWVQQYGPDSAKGDAKVIAIGSSSLIVRELQQQALLQLLDRSLMRQFKLSPERIMEQVLEGLQLDTTQLKLTEEEDAALAEADAQPDPSVQVAQINAEVDKYKVDMDYKLGVIKVSSDANKKLVERKTALDVVNTQTAGTVATAQIKEEKKAGAPARPAESSAPPDIDTVLNKMGLA